MPELPEVETVVRQLRKRSIEGQEILDIKIYWKPMIQPLNQKEFYEKVRFQRIIKIERYGKWIIFYLSNNKYLCIHLRMSGNFLGKPSKYDRAKILLSEGINLYFKDPRKFGRWILLDNIDLILSRLGPDAVSEKFTLSYFENKLITSKRMIKPFLLDQSFIAGIGNIYADEALWLAKIHPKKNSNLLTENERKDLYASIKEVLRIGIKNKGTSLGKGKSNFKHHDGKYGKNKDIVKAYGRGGLACERCQKILEKIYVAQRGTTICSSCQII